MVLIGHKAAWKTLKCKLLIHLPGNTMLPKHNSQPLKSSQTAVSERSNVVGENEWWLMTPHRTASISTAPQTLERDTGPSSENTSSTIWLRGRGRRARRRWWPSPPHGWVGHTGSDGGKDESGDRKDMLMALIEFGDWISPFHADDWVLIVKELRADFCWSGGWSMRRKV